MKFVFGPGVIHCACLGSKHQRTNELIFEFHQVKSDAKTLREAPGFQLEPGGSKHEVVIATNVGTRERFRVCFVDAGLEAGLAGLKRPDQNTAKKQHAGSVAARISNYLAPQCKTPGLGR